MRAVVVEGPERLAVRDVPEPMLGPYQALTQTLSCGLCGTDKRIIKGQFYRRSFPGILGHESVGRVVRCGERVRGFSVGDLVLRTTAVYPNEQLGGMSSLLGGLAEYGLATDWAALQQDEPQHVISSWWLSQQKLPADFDALNGGMLITLKELLSWAEQVDVRVGQTVAIVGLGPVGLTLVRICKLLGARVVAVGRRQQRLDLARELGADLVEDAALLATTGGGWLPGRHDLILDTAGDKDILERLPASLNEGGRLAIYSVPAEQRMGLDWTWGGDVPRNWSVVFRVPREQDHHQHALDCFNLGLVDFRPFLTHTFAMEDMDKAWEALSSGQGIKITVKVAS